MRELKDENVVERTEDDTFYRIYDERECSCGGHIEYKTVYTGGLFGYKYGCADIWECECGENGIFQYRYYN